MNKPVNYKEIEEFAKTINLDVKYLLGEFYEGNLYLSSLKKLPENTTFNVGGYLDLRSLTSLPANTTFNVGYSLYLSSLKSLSKNYKISLKNNLYIDDKEILSKIVYKKLDADAIMYFDNGDILVDGIYCKVIKNHEGIKKCIKIGSTKEFYVVSSNGKHSHGETIEEAKKDLVYKISNRDKSIYKNLKKDSILTFEEAVECYRVITGACFFGTKNFIETHSVSIKDYSIEEIIELTSNQYGGNTFKEFFI